MIQSQMGRRHHRHEPDNDPICLLPLLVETTEVPSTAGHCGREEIGPEWNRLKHRSPDGPIQITRFMRATG